MAKDIQEITDFMIEVKGAFTQGVESIERDVCLSIGMNSDISSYLTRYISSDYFYRYQGEPTIYNERNTKQVITTFLNNDNNELLKELFKQAIIKRNNGKGATVEECTHDILKGIKKVLDK